MAESPSAYLRRKGIKTKPSGRGQNEVAFPCPRCKEASDFSFNVKTGQWQCFRASCGGKGGLYAIKQAFGDAYRVEPVTRSTGRFSTGASPTAREPTLTAPYQQWHDDLMNSQLARHAREYLTSRRIGAEVLRMAKVGWVATHPEGRKPGNGVGKYRATRSTARVKASPGLLTFPFFRVPHTEASDKDAPVLVKLRWLPPEPVKNGKTWRYSRVAGGGATLYAPCGIDPKVVLLLVGGELDVLSVVQVAIRDGSDGFNVAASPGGEGGWADDLSDQLDDAEDVVIAYDSDAAGKKGARTVATLLGGFRCRIGTWRGNDANDDLCAGMDYFDLQAILTTATSPAADGIDSIEAIADEFVQDLFHGECGAKGFSTGWIEVDAKVGGIRMGECTVITGETGTGKTTFATQLLMNQAIGGRRVLICPFEMGWRKQLQLMAWQKLGQDPVDAGEDRSRAAIVSLGQNIYVFRKHGSVDVNAMRETLLYCITRLGIRFILIDHIDFMCGRGREQWDRKDEMIQMLEEVIVEHGAHCFVVNHPNDAESGRSTSQRSRDERVVQLRDLKGHSTIRQDFANVWSLWRPRAKSRDVESDDRGMYQAGLVVLKNRDPRGFEGWIEMLFGRDEQRFFCK